MIYDIGEHEKSVERKQGEAEFVSVFWVFYNIQLFILMSRNTIEAILFHLQKKAEQKFFSWVVWRHRVILYSVI